MSKIEVVFEEQKPWCVDVGASLEAMDDDELCAAIESGDVTSEMRVWRLGLDGWTPVDELPELAPAVASSRRG